MNIRALIFSPLMLVAAPVSSPAQEAPFDLMASQVLDYVEENARGRRIVVVREVGGDDVAASWASELQSVATQRSLALVSLKQDQECHQDHPSRLRSCRFPGHANATVVLFMISRIANQINFRLYLQGDEGTDPEGLFLVAHFEKSERGAWVIRDVRHYFEH